MIILICLIMDRFVHSVKITLFLYWLKYCEEHELVQSPMGKVCPPELKTCFCLSSHSFLGFRP